MKRIITSVVCIMSILISCKTKKKSNIVGIDSLSERVDAVVKKYQALDVFSGIVLIAENGDEKYHKAFGFANRKTKEKNTITTKFDIGSMNKSFTKTIILQLLEEGKISMNDTLGKYIKGFPFTAGTKITIKNLLNHSSGYSEYWGNDFDELSIDQKRLPALVERIKKLKLHFEPGSDFKYSNSGYVLLGAIIEKVTRKTYNENVVARIIIPLKMTETYVIDKHLVPNRAIGYYKDMRGNISSNIGFTEVPNPDGGFQSTPRDVVKFYNEYFYGSKLLSKALKNNPDHFKSNIKNRNSGKASLMAGGFRGANTAYYEVLRDKISIIVFANMDEPVAERLGADIVDLIRGETPNEPSLPANQNVYKHYKKFGLKYVEENFYKLIDNFHSEDPKGMVLNGIGYGFLKEGNIDEALKFFKLNVKLFPKDANLWDSLGEVYFTKENYKKALQYYNQALILDPNLESSKEMIKEIKSKLNKK